MRTSMQSELLYRVGQNWTIFTAAALQPRSSYEHLSVRLSVCQTRELWQNECTLSKKSSIMTNRKSPTSFLMSLIWTAYVAPKLPFPPRGAQKRKVAIFRTKNWFIVYKINAFSFLASTTLVQSIVWPRPSLNHYLPITGPPCSAVSLRQLIYLFI